MWLFKRSFSDLLVSADWHCHVLPGVDDGVARFEDSVSILGKMVEKGFRRVVLTPHLNPELFPANTEKFIRKRFDDFMGALPESLSLSLDISLGAEYMITPDFHERQTESLIQFDEGKVLVEMSYFYPSQNVDDAVFNIVSHNLTPVLAHPERYLYYAGDLDRFERLHTMGCEFQMNLLSLAGVYGPGSIRILKYLLKRGWYSYVGSDTHSVKHFDSISKMRVKRSLAELMMKR